MPESKKEAAIRRLTEKADRWGRKEKKRVADDVNSIVMNLSVDQKQGIAAVQANKRKRISHLQGSLNQGLTAIHEKHNEEVRALEEETDNALVDIRKKYEPRFKRLNEDRERDHKTVEKRVADFCEAVSELNMEQLRQLLSGETVVRGADRIKLTIEVIGDDDNSS